MLPPYSPNGVRQGAYWAMNESTTTAKGTILIVDDTPQTLQWIATLLREHGYEVRGAINGAMALRSAKMDPPELILLDVSMPHMDGYEVCQRLKADPDTADIPVIFVSSLTEVLSKVRAFEVGGADYITKPLQMEEVVARIEHQLTIRRLQASLKRQNAQLQREIQERERALEELQRTEAALRLAEEKYRSIVENAVEGIFQVTPTGQYLSVNPALAQLLGYDSPAALMASVTDIGKQLYVEPYRWAEFLAYMRRYREVAGFESEVYRADGSRLWISENVRAVQDANGQLLYYEGTVRDVTDRRQTEEELRQQRLRSEYLLLNVLPQPIAERLKQGQHTIAESFTEVTVLFADIVDFSKLATQVSPTALVEQLNQIFSCCDRLAERHGLEKIKTIGDAYMVVGGLPKPNVHHAQAVAAMALEMRQEIRRFQRADGQPYRLRIGIHSGPVVAGVIGQKKFIYDLWGETVNIASRMESQGLPDHIQVTAATYERLQPFYELAERGTILVKGMGEMVTYWLLAPKPMLDDPLAAAPVRGGQEALEGIAHENHGTIP